LLFVLFYILFLCKCVLPPGDNPTAVNKYIIIISYIVSYLVTIRDTSDAPTRSNYSDQHAVWKDTSHMAYRQALPSWKSRKATK